VVVFKEMRRQNGKSYPMSAMNQLFNGLKWYMVEKNPGAPNFIDEKDGHFSGLRGVRDTVSRELCEQV